MIDETTVLQRSEAMLFTELEHDIVMMDIQEGNYYGLEGPASRIWELMESPISVDSICAALVSEYEIDEASCHREVIAFAGELQERSVVTIVANERTTERDIDE